MKRTAIILLILPMLASAQSGHWGNNNLRVTFGAMSNTPPSLNQRNTHNGNIETTDEHIKDLTIYYGVVSAEWSYRLNPILELGVQGGIRTGKRLLSDNNLWPNYYWGNSFSTVHFEGRYAPSISLTARVHLLDLADRRSKKWDLYATGKAGLWFCNGKRKESGLGAGVNWFPTRHFGFTSELLVGTFPGSSSSANLLTSDAQFNIGLILNL